MMMGRLLRGVWLFLKPKAYGANKLIFNRGVAGNYQYAWLFCIEKDF